MPAETNCAKIGWPFDSAVSLAWASAAREARSRADRPNLAAADCPSSLLPTEETKEKEALSQRVSNSIPHADTSHDQAMHATPGHQLPENLKSLLGAVFASLRSTPIEVGYKPTLEYANDDGDTFVSFST